MIGFVLEYRLFLLLFGLMSVFACTNESNIPTNKEYHAPQVVSINQNPKQVIDLKTAVQNFVDDPALKYGLVSISIIDQQTGQIIAAHQPNQCMIPASSLKVIPTATALAILGKDYQFKTEIAYDGTITDGVLNGNIYIKGMGDPTLGSNRIDGALGFEELVRNWANAIRKAGIRQINGAVVGDGSWLPTTVNAPTWQWSDLANYYGTGVFGLNFNENSYELSFQQNSKLGGQPSITSTYPKQNINWTNELTSGTRGSGDNAYIYGAPYSKERFVRGTIPLGTGTFTIKGSIPNPMLTAAQLLINALVANGVPVRQQASTHLETKTSNQTTKILEETSPSLIEIAKHCNEESVNLYAEAILRAVGQNQTKKGDLYSSIEAVMNFWKAKGWNTEGLFLEDGCGLSPRNAVSAQHLAEFMYLISKEPNLYAQFKQTLAIGGQTGTLKNMFKGTAAQGKIWAKSGSMNRVRSYTGYAQTKSRQPITFSIIANNYTCSNKAMRQKMERLMITMCEN